MGNSNNGFGSSTTAYEVVDVLKPDVSGKVALVTGATTGIGKETAKALIKAGFSNVIIGCRNIEKMKKTKQEMLEEFPNASIHDLLLDLGDSKSIENFVSEFQQMNLPLHLLINNAGVMGTPQWTTKDGYEYQNGINHLGTFRLTLLLLPIMSKSKGEKRIISVSSAGHKWCPSIDFDNFHFRKEGTYSRFGSYGQSKLCNILFSSELNRRLSKIYKKEDPDHFICCSVHPGGVATELGRDVMPPSLQWIYTGMEWIMPLVLKSPQQGAATSVFGAFSSSLKGEEYLADCHIDRCSDLGLDEKLQHNLFEFSLKETNLSFPDLK